MDDNPEHCSFRVVADGPDFARGYALAIDHHAADELIQGGTWRVAVQKNLVLFLELVARVCNPVCQFAVVRQ